MSRSLINWDSYNKALAEIKLQDNYGSAFKILNEAEMRAEQVAQLPAPTGASAYGYKNYADGAIATWYSNYSSTVENVPDVISQMNSNSGAGQTNTYNWQFSANTDFSGGGGGGSTGSTFHASDVTGAGGASGAISFLQNTVTPAVAAAGLGIKLGKAVDSALYNANPDFWDNVGLSSLNPSTWDSITMDMSNSGWEGVLKRGFNALLGINTHDKTAQMYIDQDAAAYLAQYMQENGVFGAQTTQSDTYTGQPQWLLYPSSYNYPLVYTGNPALSYETSTDIYSETLVATSGNVIFCFYKLAGSPTITYVAFTNSSGASYTYNEKRINKSSGEVKRDYTKTVNLGAMQPTAAGQFYGVTGGIFTFNPEASGLSNISYNYNVNSLNGDANARDFAIIYYNSTQSSSGGVDGISTQDGATTPNFSNCTTPQDYLNALQTQYPDMFNNAITQTVAQPDGSVVSHKYVPIGTGTGTDNQTSTSPDATGQSQTDTLINTATATQTQLQTLVDLLTKTFTPTLTPTKTTNPPDSGTGQTPPVVAPTGSASALWTVYNPTQAQLNSFGAWLWSSSFIDQVLKLFNNPMQSIIGVHKIFASPAISGSNNITVGYLDSGVPSNVVGAQYTTINCGSVSVREQFGNVFDYEDTQVRLYLPFIGIVQLDTADVMRGSVSVVYHVDVITGACLAEVKVSRDGGGGTLYQYSGDAAARYPISSGSYMGVVSGVLGVVGGIASGIMSGGATLPMAAGAIAGGLSGAKTQVQHSGSFAGNAGAMGGKKPYLIIERPQSAVADGYGAYQGTGANNIASVGAMSGYFKMTDIHTANISGASEAEIASIVQTLESGAIA